MTSIDVVYCTYQRPLDLKAAILSIFKQTLKPKGVIIIDNSNDDSIESLQEEFRELATLHNIEFTYRRNVLGNSLTIARNLAVKTSQAEFLLYLDDDTELDSNYISVLSSFLEKNPNTVALQGYINRDKPTSLKNIISRCIGEFHFRPEQCRSLRSISACYPFPAPTKPIACDFLSGANHLVKRKVVQVVSYDENLTKYADGEDLDIALRIARLYPNQVWLLPQATLIHKSTPTGRMPSQDLLKMQEAYGLYLINKLYGKDLTAWLFYGWNRVCRLGIRGILAIVYPKNRGKYFLDTLVAYYFSLRNMGSILAGRIQLS